MLTKLSLLKSFICFALLLSTITCWSQLSKNPTNDVMMQGFWWKSYEDSIVKKEGGLYLFLKNKAPQFKKAGINLIWMPPPSDGNEMGYFPKELFKFSNQHGTESELKKTLVAFKKNNIHGMADLIINHRNGTTDWADFTNPVWDCTALVEDDEIKTIPSQLKPCSGENDEGEGFIGARDINHKSVEVQKTYNTYLQKLKKLGFDSWRYDFTKGYPAVYVGEYNKNSSPYFSVGEYWDANIGMLQNWINNSEKTLTSTTKKSATFDFSLYYILERAVNGAWWELNNKGKMPGLSGTLNYEQYSVTFTENHDAHDIKGEENILKANAYILTHGGIPMLFMKHWLTYTDKINELIAVRKQNGIHANSQINIVASDTFYAAYIDNKVAVQLGNSNWQPSGTDWILNTQGKEYAVWSKIKIKTVTD